MFLVLGRIIVIIASYFAPVIGSHSAIVAQPKSKILELAPSTYAPFNSEAFERQSRFADPSLPSKATVDDLAVVTDRETASKILSIGESVYKHYPWSLRPARFPAPEEVAVIFAAESPGWCDGAARLIQRLLGESIRSDNFGFMIPMTKAPDPAIVGENYTLGGHTVVHVRLERGAVLVDAMYGFIFVTTEPHFSRDTFVTKNYRMLALSVWPAEPDRILSPYSGRGLYARAAVDRSQVRFESEGALAVMPTVRVPAGGALRIGNVDGSDRDVAAAFGGYASHIGYWYLPTKHVWSFVPEAVGTLTVKYHLLGGDAEGLRVTPDLAIEAKGAKLIAIDSNYDMNADQHLTLTLAVDGPFAVELKSKSVTARRVDAVVVAY